MKDGLRPARWIGRALQLSSLALLLALSQANCGGGGGSSAGPQTAEGGEGLVGKPAPAFTAEPVTGDGPKTLKEAEGKVVIVDFWATYCDPCKKSFPKYQELVDQFGGDLAVIAVALDEKGDASKESIEEFAKNTGVKFTVMWDTEHSVAKLYNPPKMPTSFVVDKSGVIRHIHAGYEAGEENKIADEVKSLLK